MSDCKKCGAELAPGANFCHICGRAVNYTPTRKKRGNGQGTAVKRGKTWTGFASGYAFTDADGKRHRRRPSKGGFRTKAEALAWAVQHGPAPADAPVPKLIDLWTSWSENDMLQLSASKRTAYKIARKRIEPIIGREIDTLSLDDLQAVINEKCSSYYTAKDVKTLLSHLYKRAMASNTNRGRVTQNLAEFLVLPEFEEAESEPFTAEEVKALWVQYDAGNTPTGYILLMCYTGMMPGELLLCEKSMVDLDACEIRGAGAKTKVRKRSAIAFPDFLRPLVADLLEQNSPNSRAQNRKLLCINRDNFYEEFYAALDAAGIDNPKGADGKHRLTPYSCRHTYGTEAVRLGLHPAVIQKMLRHSNTKTQEKYTHLGGDDLHNAVNQMQRE